MIYDQKKTDVCFGCATANLWEIHADKNPPSLEKIVEWYKSVGLDPEKGCSAREFFFAIKEHPMYSIKIKSYRLIWTSAGNVLNHPPLVLANMVKEGALFVCKRGILLDENGVMKRGATKKGLHAMACIGIDMKTKTFILENSYGEEYGNKGYARMKFVDAKDLVKEIWEVKF